MPNIPDGKQLEANILKDMRVELADEFDKNFQRKAFFTDAWKPRKDPKALGSLLVVTGAMRRSIKSEVVGHGVRFSSSRPTQRSITRAAKARSLSGRITAQAKTGNAIRFAPINAASTCRSVSS
ncbi:hypothetical protein [Prevotella sp.]|uniref:hypothetical protein n=1 Tax=Prevotella sp. TaxID=59823 RepID=UPI0025D95B88|nr:hypothetical protein [Prevotella sp.]